jgi:hypothetical protein
VPNSAEYDHFGNAVSLSADGNTALIGALAKAENPYESVPPKGAAYIFTRNGISWSQQAKLLASDKASSDYFGNSIALF